MYRFLPLLLLALAAACENEAVPAGSPDSPDAAEPASAAVAAEEGPVVVFLGTSLTAGLGLRDPGERFPERLDRIADSAGTPIRVVNAGVSGETSAGGLRRLDWVLDRPMEVLVVELGANDGLRGQETEGLEQNLRTIVQRARDRHPGVSVVLLGMEAPPNLGLEYTRRFHDVFPAVAEAERAALVPFLLEGVAGVAELNQSDRIHPTAEGHERMARTVWPVLDSVLRAREGSR
jgi:acyl-CoA thioesterase-1